jgi:hypothetical protein
MFSEYSPSSQLASEKAQQLVEQGFAIIDGPYSPLELDHLSKAFDEALATADPSDVRVSSSTRAWDIVSRTAEFQRVYTHPPLLQACRIVIGDAFKLSATCFRTLNPGASAQPLHVDVKFQADGWPILGFILMVDEFSSENGATRFVPRSHERAYDPSTLSPKVRLTDDAETLACGTAGAMIIFNGSAWHGHSNNFTRRQRRSIQGHFISRDALSALDYGARLRPEALARLGAVERYVLGLNSAA